MKFRVFNDENQFIELINKMNLTYLYVEIPTYNERVKIISEYYLELESDGVLLVCYENSKLKGIQLMGNTTFEKCCETIPNLDLEVNTWQFNVFEIVRKDNKLNLHDMREDLHS